MAKRWKQTETNYLNRYAHSKTLAELTQRFDADPSDVLAKLGTLGLRTKDGKPEAQVEADPVFEIYEEGFAELYKKHWAKAIKLFEQVVAESDQAELTDRARQLATAARRSQAEARGEETPEDPFLHAVYLRNRGDLDDALKLCGQGGRSGKDERFAYLAAALHAVAGRPKEAAETLAKAIEMNPKNRVHAFHDPDFAELRNDSEHAALFGLE